MLPHLSVGIIGALIALGATSWIATRRERRPAAAYGLSALFLFGLIYVGLLQTIVLYARPVSPAISQLGPETLYLAYAVVSAGVAVAATVGLVAAFLAAVRPGPRDGSRAKSIAKAVVFSVLITAAAAPFLVHNQSTIARAIAANEAEIAALQSSYTVGLDRLVKMGVVRKIEADESAVTHYIAAPLSQLGSKGMAEYAKASSIYHIYITGGEPKPIILRDAITTQKLGTYRLDGVFVVEAAANVTHGAAGE